MLDGDEGVWTPTHRDLWTRISAHDFEPAGHALTFTVRLARDHGWALADARAAVEEYRRFCFLAVTCGRPVTPSEEVDEVWHQHLTFSRDYWQHWCGKVLRTALHHDPTKGGPTESARFAVQYAETLALYEAWFGSPPVAFWPGTADRFGKRPRFAVMDRRRTLVFSLPRGLGHLAFRGPRQQGLLSSRRSSAVAPRAP